MNKPRHFEIVEGQAVFQPIGEISLERAMQLILSAIVYVRERRFNRLLVVTNGLTGLGPLSLADRYFYARAMADAAGGQVCIALVARPEMIDPQKFGTTVAENAGLRYNAFESQQEALAWLKSESQAQNIPRLARQVMRGRRRSGRLWIRPRRGR